MNVLCSDGKISGVTKPVIDAFGFLKAQFTKRTGSEPLNIPLTQPEFDVLCEMFVYDNAKAFWNTRLDAYNPQEQLCIYNTLRRLGCPFGENIVREYWALQLLNPKNLERMDGIADSTFKTMIAMEGRTRRICPDDVYSAFTQPGE